MARNQSLTYATMDWVLILDADEEVPYESAAHLKSLLIKEPEAEAWLFTIASYTEKGAPPIKHPNLRLFRNRPFYKFSGKIHEQIKPSIVSCNPSAQIRHTNLTIFHHGYTQQEMIRKQKNQRNIEILQRELKEDPANPFHHYNLGVSFAAQQSFKQARKHFEAAYTNLKGYMGFEPNLFRDYALCFI